MTDPLTQMERSGSIVTFTDPSNDERAKIMTQYLALKGLGHAIVISDEFHSRDEQKPLIQIFHYKTCTRCLMEDHRGKIHSA